MRAQRAQPGVIRARGEADLDGPANSSLVRCQVSRVRAASLLLDASGTLVLPDYHLMAALLGELGLEVSPALLAAAHPQADRPYAELLMRHCLPVHYCRPFVV